MSRVEILEVDCNQKKIKYELIFYGFSDQPNCLSESKKLINKNWSKCEIKKLFHHHIAINAAQFFSTCAIRNNWKENRSVHDVCTKRSRKLSNFLLHNKARTAFLHQSLTMAVIIIIRQLSIFRDITVTWCYLKWIHFRKFFKSHFCGLTQQREKLQSLENRWMELF